MENEKNLCFSDRKIYLILRRAKKYMHDKEELFSYLDRQMGEDRVHCNLLKIVYVLGIIQKILQSENCNNTAKECADMMVQNYKISSTYAAWGINAWCEAIGIPVCLPIIEKSGNNTANKPSKIEKSLDWEGDIDKETHISIIGSLFGNIDAPFVGNIGGDIEGNINNILYGNVGGDVIGNINGELHGTIFGDLIGNVYGIIIGDVVGDVTGSVYGTVTGNIEGSVEGDILGEIQGDVYGDVNGNIYGEVLGTIFGEIEDEYRVVTGIYESHDGPTREEVDSIIETIIPMEHSITEVKLKPIENPRSEEKINSKPQVKAKPKPKIESDYNNNHVLKRDPLWSIYDNSNDYDF